MCTFDDDDDDDVLITQCFTGLRCTLALLARILPLKLEVIEPPYNCSQTASSNHSQTTHAAMVDCSAILMLIINFSLELFNGPVFFPALKRWIICIIHTPILWRYYKTLPPLPPARHRTYVHARSHPHSLSLCAAMKYVHIVYSLINWGCRGRHERLHKAIPRGYFSRFILLAWRWSAGFLLCESCWSFPVRQHQPPTSPAQTVSDRKAARGQGNMFPYTALWKKRM